MTGDLAALLEEKLAELVDRRVDDRLAKLGIAPGEHDPLVALADTLPVSRSQANRIARSGAIADAVLVGRTWCARRSALDAYLAERAAAGRTLRPEVKTTPSALAGALDDLGFDDSPPARPSEVVPRATAVARPHSVDALDVLGLRPRSENTNTR